MLSRGPADGEILVISLAAMLSWLERHARTIAAAIVIVLGTPMLRGGIAGMTS